jgi:hypothetical protein
MTEPAPTALDLLKRAEALLSALHGSVARHDNLAAHLGCAGCELRDLISAALPSLAAVPAAVPPPDRAAVLLEAADELGHMDYDTDSNDYGYDTYRDAWNGGVMDGAEVLRRLAAEPPQPARCAECDHPQDAHQEGDDPVTPGACSGCGDDDRHDYEAAETPQPETQAAFVPPAAESLPLGALDSATDGASALNAWARDPHGRNFLAHALVQLARDGWLRNEPGEGFEPVRDHDDVPEPINPDTLTDRLRCPQCSEDITDYGEDDFVYRTGDERPYCSGECVIAAHRKAGTACTCAVAGAAFAPAGHYADCPQANAPAAGAGSQEADRS